MFFWLFNFEVSLWHQKFITADHHCSVCQQSIRYSATRTRFLKKFVFAAKRFTDAFPEKRWTKHGVNKLLQTLWDTGTVYRQPEI